MCVCCAAYGQATRLPPPLLLSSKAVYAPATSAQHWQQHMQSFPSLKAKDSGTGRQPLETPTSTAVRSKTGGMPEHLSTSFQSVSRVRCRSRSWCTMMDDISAQAMTLLPSHVLNDKEGYLNQCAPSWHAQRSIHSPHLPLVSYREHRHGHCTTILVQRPNSTIPQQATITHNEGSLNIHNRPPLISPCSKLKIAPASLATRLAKRHSFPKT